MSRPWEWWRRTAPGSLLVVLLFGLLAGLPVAQASPLPGQEPGAFPGHLAAPALAAQAQGFVQRIVDLTNQERARQGLPALTIDPALNSSAQAHSQDMASRSFFDHAGSNGSDVGQRIAAAGYNPMYAYGENIAAGQTSPEEAVNAWMNSPEHRSNILSPYYQHIGVGYAYNESSTYGHYWTQNFGSHGPNQPAPPPPPPPPTSVPPPPPTAVAPTRVPPAPVLPTRTPPAPTVAPIPPTPTHIPPTPTPQPPLPNSISLSFVQQVVDLTNQERARAGLPALILDADLCQAAQAHSDDMAAHDFFGHTGSDGSTVTQRVSAAGYSPIYWCGENIAAGQPTAEEVVDAWMSSKAHRDNILNSNYHHIGVGYAYNQGSLYWHYWTQVLASHSAIPPSPAPTPAPPPGGWHYLIFLPLLLPRAIG